MFLCWEDYRDDEIPLPAPWVFDNLDAAKKRVGQWWRSYHHFEAVPELGPAWEQYADGTWLFAEFYVERAEVHS